MDKLEARAAVLDWEDWLKWWVLLPPACGWQEELQVPGGGVP